MLDLIVQYAAKLENYVFGVDMLTPLETSDHLHCSQSWWYLG
jgi:hypothetical protein